MSNQRRPIGAGAKFLIVTASLMVVIAGIKSAQKFVSPLLIALFVAMISLPLLNWLQSKKIPGPIAVLLTLLADAVVLAAPVYVVGQSIRSFTRAAPRYQERLKSLTENVLEWLREKGVDVPSELSGDMLDPSTLFDVLTGTLQGTAAAVSNLLLIVLTVAFVLLEASGFPAKLERAFGEKAQSSKRFETIKREIQRYLAIKTVVSLITGITVGVALWLLGIDFPVLWGLLAFALNYVPNLGSILAAIPPVLMALVQYGGVGRAIGVIVLFAAVNLLLGSLVEPHFMGRTLGISTLVVFLSLVFWGWVLGPIGMLLSVPLTMLVKIMLENTEDLRWVSTLLEGARSSD